MYWLLGVAVMVVACARYTPRGRRRHGSNTTLDHIAPPGAGLGLTGIVGGDEIEGQPPRTMHIALTEGERVEYEMYAYYQDRRAGCWREVICNDRWRKCHGLPCGVSRSKLTNEYLAAKLQSASTIRNWRTVLTLLKMVDAQ